VIVALYGLEIFGYHGVEEQERREGQLFLFDVSLDVGDRGASDRIEDAIDYREVAVVVRNVSDGTRFELLEALAPAVADALLARFPVDTVRVRVRKPEVRPAGMRVAHSSVTVERRRE
jgi:dihydroneopterin aldolase